MFNTREKLISADFVKSGETTQEWISVKDRLPKNVANKVLVCCGIGSICLAHYEEFMGDKWWYNIEGGSSRTFPVIEGVTHWMPLPKPPKGE